MLSLCLSRPFSKSGLFARDLAEDDARIMWFAVPRLVPHYDFPVHLSLSDESVKVSAILGCTRMNSMLELEICSRIGQ